MEKAIFSHLPGDTSGDENKSNAGTTIRVLKENCGKCHQSALPTADPKALAIFDLDKEPWYSSVSDKHLEGISRRISAKTRISDSDRAAILEFIACIRKDVENDHVSDRQRECGN